MRSMPFIILLLLVISACSGTKNAVHTATPIEDSTMQWMDSRKRSCSIDSYAAFVKDLQPELDKMAGYQVVGLGEGTHGTSEFQTIRAFITRYLTEEKGFNIVCLENSYGWCAVLDRYIQTGEGDLDALMQENLLGMWQNAEMKVLLQRMQDVNSRSIGKIHLAGIDYSSIAANSTIIKHITDHFDNSRIDSLAGKLVTNCHYMDKAYADLNKGGKKFAVKDIIQNGVHGYETVIALNDALQKLSTNDKATITADTLTLLHTALYNCELTFNSIYQSVKRKKGTSRDEIMAQMIKWMADHNPGSRIIVWAHNAHMARRSIFSGGNGGGTGAFLETFFPGRYFVAGTGTAGGHFSATTDRFIVNTSRFKKYPLPAAADSSWEYMMTGFRNDQLYFDLTNAGRALPAKELRFTGYGPAAKKDFVKVSLNTLFDGFFFIKNTHGTTMLR